MGRERLLRRPGEGILLEGREYRIEAVEGYGGSTVVYRACYEDSLNGGCYHRVLVKELFPYDSRGRIYRDSFGNICCEGEGKELMEDSRKRFYLGNQANLGLLEQIPEQVSGNLNSYEAYGTYYSVLSVHGGTNLETLLEEGTAAGNLREAAEIICKLLEALECFHRNKLLHLDISPDNILILQKQALLIDYNSVWQMEKQEREGCSFSEKEGYSAPEIKLRDMDAISCATDLYSVCAVFFHMLVGRKLSEDEIVGNGLFKCFPRDLKIFQGESPGAAQKAVQIVTKGLHMLARKRYQSIGELRREVEELILRIDGKGISHSALWEGSRKNLSRKKRMEEPYLVQNMQMDSGEILSLEDCRQILAEGGKQLLIGSGGMGKTRFLLELWNREMQSYRPNEPVTIYIPLADYQERGGESCFIRRYLLRHLCFWELAEDMEAAMHELERFLSGFPGGKKTPVILLLDGLNEAGSRRSGLVKEIEELGSRYGLGILVTDRTNSVKQYGLKEFQAARLLPLSLKAVRKELADAHIVCPQSQEILELLCNPMMLSLYRRTEEVERENRQSREELWTIQSADEMVLCYLDCLRIQKQRLDSGNQTEQLRSAYLLCHLLPGIAAELKRRKKTLLTAAQLSRLTEKNYRNLQKKDFTLAFPEYLGKSRLMFQGIADELEWFDYAVCEQLSEQLNLLEVTSDGNYRLIHDNFINPLSKRNAENRKKQNRGKGKRLWVSGGMALLAALLLLMSGLAYRSKRKQTEQAIHTANQRVLRCAQDLSIQILEQKETLESLMEENLFEESVFSLEELHLRIQDRMEQVDRSRLGSSWYSEDYIRRLEETGAELPIEAVESLYRRPEEMAEMRKEAMARLEEKLCGEDSPYFGREKRGELVDTYENWLDAYGEVVCLELYEILVRLERGERKEMLDALGEVKLFREYMLEHPLSDKTEDTLSELLEGAEKELEGLGGAEMDMVKHQLLER